MTKQIWWSVILLLVIVGGIYYFLNFVKTPSIDVRHFSGEVVSIEGEVIKLNGVFGKPSQGILPDEFLKERDFVFVVDEHTIFEKLETNLPTWQQLQSMGKVEGNVARYNIQDLPKNEGIGSLDDLTEWVTSLETATSSSINIVVEVEFPSSIYEEKNPLASSLFYHVLITPNPLPPSQAP